MGGRYSLVEPFGADERFAGGKVQTWRAQDSVVERAVVLRVITPGGNSAKLFLDRAHEMSLIAHPGLGVVYEAVDHGDYAIVVCEWIEGTSLANTVAAHGPLTPTLARHTLGQVAEAITVAHHAGLPIGGITPERVVLRDNGSVAVAGVPALFADERGDIQQLGALLYAALTGEAADVDDPDLAKKLHRGVPRDLAVLCQRALDRDPARALGSAAAFAAVLRPRAKPPSSTAATAGRTTGRLGGLDGETTVREHDTSPTQVPRKGTRQTVHKGSPTAPIAAVANDVGSSAAIAASAPPTQVIPTSRAGSASAQPAPPTRRIPAGAKAPNSPKTSPAQPAVAGPPPAAPAAAPTTVAGPPPAAPAPVQTTAFAPAPSPSKSPSPSSPSSPSTPPTQVIPTRPKEADRAGPTVWDVPSAAAAPPIQAPPTGANPVVAPEVVRDARDSREAADLLDDQTGQPGLDSASDSPIDTADDLDPWSDDTGAWGTYDTDDPEESPYEGGQTRRKILLYAVPIAALILIVLIAIFVGQLFSDAVANDPAVVPSSEPGVPTAGATEGAASTEEASTDPGAAVALPVVSATVFNPFGDGESEHGEDVALSYDGDPASAWKTFTYQNSAAFGNLKPGVGIIFDLGEEHAITSIELATTMPGSAIEIRAGAAPDAALESYQVIGTLDPFTETGTVALEQPVRARFVIVWFVRLVEADGGFQAALAECRILGT